MNLSDEIIQQKVLQPAPVSPISMEFDERKKKERKNTRLQLTLPISNEGPLKMTT